MDYIALNVVSIVLATCAGLVVSILYGKLSTSRREGGGTGVLIVAAILGEFWFCCILAGALILAPRQAGAWTMAMGSAVVIWIGFVLPVLIVTELFRGVRLWRTAMDSAHWLAVMLAQVVVL